MKRFPFDVVAFDLDGTLLDTAPDLTAAVNHMLAQSGRNELTQDEVIKMIGGGDAPFDGANTCSHRAG